MMTDLFDFPDTPALPNVRFVNADGEDVEVDLSDYDPGPDDDELLEETPPDVVAMLGFDPLELLKEEPGKEEPGKDVSAKS